MIKFVSTVKEFEDISSGKTRQIIRKIDKWNPVFEELEKIQASYASKDPIYGRSALGMIYIDGDNGSEGFRIKKISYKDGCVIIEW